MKEITAYTVAVGKISMSFRYWKSNKRFFEILKGFDGFLGITPVEGRGTLLLFATKNDAIRAKNDLDKTYCVKTGDNICECYIPEEYLKGGAN